MRPPSHGCLSTGMIPTLLCRKVPVPRVGCYGRFGRMLTFCKEPGCSYPASFRPFTSWHLWPRMDPAPCALPPADANGENQPWKGGHLCDGPGSLFAEQVCAQVGFSGQKRSVGVRSHPSGCMKQKSGFLPHTEKWFPYSF